MSGQERQQILVTVGADGRVSAETKGLKGAACLPYIDLLEELLEATTTESRYTSDFSATGQHSATAQDGEERNELGGR